MVDGQEIEIEERGEGRAILFLHGLTTDRRLLLDACEPVLDRPGLRRLYVDLPGHGESTANLVGASADGLVAALRQVVRQLPDQRAAIVAHSYGAYLALGLARDLASLEGLFLINPIVHPDLAWRRLPLQRFAVVEEGLEFTDEQERQTFDAEACVYTREMLERFRRVVDPAHRKAHRFFVEMVRSRYALSSPVGGALASFDRPVHVLCGQNDYWAGFEDPAGLARIFPRCDLRVISGCGHLLPLEKPAELAASLDEWLRALAEPASTSSS